MGEVESLHRTASRAWVRVTRRDHHGFVEFQFSLGDPAIYLEMTLPPAAFDEFCAQHRARALGEVEARRVDEGTRRWCAAGERGSET